MKDDQGQEVYKITIATTRVIDQAMYPDWLGTLRQIGVPSHVIKELETNKHVVYRTKHRGLDVITTYEVEK